MGALAGKVALITGGGVGTSRGIARVFAREGASVVLADVDHQPAMQTARGIEASGGRAFAIATDVGSRADVYAAVEATAARYGRLDVLVNTAIKTSQDVLLEHKSDDMLEEVFRVGLWGVWWAMQAALPPMKRQGGGRIINFYSNDADAGVWLHSDYNLTKAAVLGLTRSAAMEWARYGVLVNCICPASAGRKFEELKRLDPGIEAAAGARNPLGRIGDPEKDIAPVAVFLASDASAYVTGEVIHVDGGQHLPRRDSRPKNLETLELM